MKTFKQFLKEDTGLSSDQLIDMIKRDCVQWIEACNGETLYRGINENFLGMGELYKSYVLSDEEQIKHRLIGPHVLKIKVLKDRQPVDSSDELHETLDKIFYDATGIKFRSESVFCVKSKQIAGTYGHVFVVLPIGPVKYAWSPYIDDAFSAISEGGIPPALIKQVERVWPEVYEKFKSKMPQLHPTFEETFDNETAWHYQSALQHALVLLGAKNLYKFNKGIVQCPVRHEVMIACNSYYAISDLMWQKIAADVYA